MRRINMKKLKVKKGSTCMACLACVEACSEAFYKEFHPDKSCIQIVEKKSVRPMACPQCGKCAEACPEGAITQNAKGVYMINKKKCTGCGACAKAVWTDRQDRGQSGIQMYRMRYLCKSLSDGCTGSSRRVKSNQK